MSMAIGGKDEASIAFTMHRTLEVPRERVWQAYTDPAALQRWWFPNGSEILTCTGTLRPGAMFLYGARLADGGELWGRMLYSEIWPPMQLVYIASHTNARGGVVRHPTQPNWPIEILTTVNFAKDGGGTKISVRALPRSSTDADKQAFSEDRYGMRDRLNEALERLEHHLGK
jgi:uncharacterized protein YndB with AHSA1/START domain